MGAGRAVDLEDVGREVAVGQLDADVITADGAGPVGNTVGVDLAAGDTDGRRVLLMGSDAGSAAALGVLGGHSADSSRGSEENGSDGEHVCGW